MAKDNWIDSYAMVSVWPSIGMAYFGVISAAGAADNEIVFRSSSLPIAERLSAVRSERLLFFGVFQYFCMALSCQC